MVQRHHVGERSADIDGDSPPLHAGISPKFQMRLRNIENGSSALTRYIEDHSVVPITDKFGRAGVAAIGHRQGGGKGGALPPFRDPVQRDVASIVYLTIAAGPHRSYVGRTRGT